MRKSHKLGFINFDIIAVLKYTMVYTKVFTDVQDLC